MLKKIIFRPGVNRENTRYASETMGNPNSATNVAGGWYESEKVRFRSGSPEKIGGWARISSTTFLGVCRSLWNWITLGSLNLIGVGTNLKFYIEQGGVYNDVTPIRASSTINNNPFALTASTTVTVTDTSHGAITGDFVTFSGAVDIGSGSTNVTAAVLNLEFQITVLTANTYTITLSVTPNAAAIAGSPGGGASVVAAYQISVGPEYQVPLVGWGAGGWGLGTWGNGVTSTIALRIWSQSNFGEDLVFNPRGGGLYYWDATNGVTTRAVLVSSLGGDVTFTDSSSTGLPTVVTATITFTAGEGLQFAGGTLPTGISAATTYYVTAVVGLSFGLLDSSGSAISTSSTGTDVYISLIENVPSVVNYSFVSDASRFVFAFGCNDYGSNVLNPMLVRWSNQESPTEWLPSSTNQAGSVQFSHGSQIVSAIQARQEIVVFTDSSVYSLQYVGAPVVWSSQLLGDNVSIYGPNAVALGSGTVYWMGVDNFYKYDGRIQTLRCDLRQYIFSDINKSQNLQVFASTSEGFNEVWWFYCSAGSYTVDKYVVYNYAEDIWYYGLMGRTAWLDSGLRDYPLAATYAYNLVNHEEGVDDNITGTPVAIAALISSSEFDIEDGHNFGFIWRVLPDMTFRDSDGDLTPQATMTLIPMQNSGSGANNPRSTAGTSNATIQRIATAPIEEFTGQVYIRVRGRQLIFQMESNRLGTQWQLGAPRIDIKTDGRRGNT
jgi:hypothetical protein